VVHQKFGGEGNGNHGKQRSKRKDCGGEQDKRKISISNERFKINSKKKTEERKKRILPLLLKAIRNITRLSAQEERKNKPFMIESEPIFTSKVYCQELLKSIVRHDEQGPIDISLQQIYRLLRDEVVVKETGVFITSKNNISVINVNTIRQRDNDA